MKQMYFFLDVDGVLNGFDDWNAETFPINSTCVEYLGKTADHFRKNFDVHFVLSSSWRDGFNPQEGHSEEMLELLKRLEQVGITVEDRTPFFIDKYRSDEINFYILEHNLESAECIALDDTRELFLDTLLKNVRLYIVKSATGFSQEDFENLTGNNYTIFSKLKNILGLLVRKFS